MKNLFICFSAGCLGALVNSLTVWLFGDLGFTQSAGVSMAPALSPGWLYPRLVWGGIWGFLFIFPMLTTHPFKKGMFLSIFPTLVQLLIVFPYKAKKGLGGIELGLLTPAFVVFFNMVWGVVTALAVRSAR